MAFDFNEAPVGPRELVVLALDELVLGARVRLDFLDKLLVDRNDHFHELHSHFQFLHLDVSVDANPYRYALHVHVAAIMNK